MTNLLAYDYLRLVFEEEFPGYYLQFIHQDNLHFELTNILELCAPLMKGLDGDDPFLKDEVVGTIADYLQEENAG